MTKNGGRQCPECGRQIIAATRGRPRRYCGRACQARAYRARSDRGTATATAARTGAGSPAPNRRSSLDLSGIVSSAIAIADADGIEALSMRGVAARMDVPVMSIYRHVRNKQELIRAMVDAAFAEQGEQPDAAADARTVLEREARREWALYRRHPWMLRVLGSSRPTAGRSVIQSIDRIVRALTDDGVDADIAFWAYLLLSGYVQGAALLMVSEHEAVRDTGVSSAGWRSLQHSRLERELTDPDRYAWLAHTLAQGGPGVFEDLEEWFEFGLQRVLEGITAYVGQEVNSPERTHSPAPSG